MDRITVAVEIDGTTHQFTLLLTKLNKRTESYGALLGGDRTGLEAQVTVLEPGQDKGNTFFLSRLVGDPSDELRDGLTSLEHSVILIRGLCRSLVEAGLVDRFRVVVFPVITGSTGRERIYDGYPDVGLEMVASRTFDGRIQLLEYVPTVLTGPPTGDDSTT